MDTPPFLNHKPTGQMHRVDLPTSTRLVNDYLAQVIAERTDQAATISSHYKALWQSIARLFDAGGKRLRPFMVLSTYQAYGGRTVDAVVPAAAAQEMLHLSMLMHDDIIDRELIRYGTDNVSGSYIATYAELLVDEAERRHFADSAALLAGDLLIAESSLQLSLCTVPAAQIVASQALLHRAIFRVVGGELLDTEAAFRPARSIDPLTIAAEKTASYSFVGPLTMGATLAGAPERDIAILTHLGMTIGIAYQLRDDIMGIYGDADVMGKSADSDLKEGKRTLLIEEFYKRADKAQQSRFDALFGRTNLSPEELDHLRRLIEQAGARDAIESYIENHRLQAHELITSLSIADADKHTFAAFTDRCLDRLS